MSTNDPLASLVHALGLVYGGDSMLLNGQRERYGRALGAFAALYGPGDVTLVRAPGRVNLIGEHTDYNHGYVLPTALDKDTLVLGRARADRLLRLNNVEPERFSAVEFYMSENIAPGPLGDWGNYVKAAAQALFVHSHGRMCGMDMLVSGAPPWGTPRAAGLSSSSALLVVAALTMCTLNDITLPKADFARLCSEAEWYVGTRGGIMDQFISIMGQLGHALLLDCRPQINSETGVTEYHAEPVHIPDGCRIMICNSGVQRQKTRSQYNARVAECRLAVALLKPLYPHITHLRDISVEEMGLPEAGVMNVVASLPEQISMDDASADAALRETLDALGAAFLPDQVFTIRARARHVVTENARVLAGARALRAGQTTQFGRLMNASHESMSRDYAASCPEVDALAEIARRAPGVMGARVTGAGWGGCIVVLAADADTGFEEYVSQAYRRATRLSTSIFVCRSGPGASVVGQVSV